MGAPPPNAREREYDVVFTQQKIGLKFKPGSAGAIVIKEVETL